MIETVLDVQDAFSLLDPYLLLANLGVVQRRNLSNPRIENFSYQHDENIVNYRGMDLDMRFVFFLQLKE